MSMAAPDFIIQPKQAFLYAGKRIVYAGRARDTQRSYLFSDAAGIQVHFSGEELRQLRDRNELRDWFEPGVAGDDNGRGFRRAAISVAGANAAEKAELARRLDYCMAWELCRAPRTPEGLQPIIDTVYQRREAEAKEAGRFEPCAPSVSSVQKYIRAWLARGQIGEALVPQNRLRGNRTIKLQRNTHDVIMALIDEFYLTRERYSVAGVHRKIMTALKAKNSTLPADEKIPVPSYEALRKAVSGLCQYTVDYCRFGKKKANEKWRAVGPGIVTDHANEVWEIDDTRVDAMCLAEDGETVIGRPWVILVIDRYTRMIMSFLITFHPPDTTSAMEAIARAILNKEELLRKYGVKGSYPAEGRPDYIHVDNGKQYNSTALIAALAILGIAHRTMPVHKAWYRGIIERAIGTMLRQVFHIVSGTTFSNIFDRDTDPAPESVATATIEELARKLLEWIVHEYLRIVHKGIDEPPLALWLRDMAKNEQRMPLARDTVLDALSITVARTPSKVGLEYCELIYNSEHVAALRALPKDRVLKEVTIRIDRENLALIHFHHPHANEWLPAYLRGDLMARVNGRSLEEYQIARALRRHRRDEFGDRDPSWAESYEELERSRQKREGSSKLSERVKAAGERERLLKQAGYLTKPEGQKTPAEGEDLSSMLDRAVSFAAAPKTAAPEDAEAEDKGAADWAARNGLGAHVRKPKQES